MNKIKHNWFIVCKSNALKGKPKRVMLFGKAIVVFRTKSGISALLDRCPHRNAPLSCGRIINDNIQCPYHGWTFNKQGECIDIPGLCITSHHSLRTVPCYSTLEYQNFIWICPALNYKPSDLPYWPIEIHFQKTIFQCTVRANLINTLENFLDATHTHFIHSGLIRKNNNRQSVKAHISRSPHRVDICYNNESKQNGLISRIFEKERFESVGRYLFPSLGQIEYRTNEKTNLLISLYLTPMDENQLEAFIVIYSPSSWIPLFVKKAFVLPFLKIALKQDLTILETQADNISLFGGESFIFSPQDLIRSHVTQIIENEGNAPMVEENTIINI